MISKLNIGLLIFIFLMISLIVYMPSYQPFSPFNTNWNGLSSLYKNSSGIVENPSMISKIKGTIIIPQPFIKPSPQEIHELRDFLNNGGTIIIAGNGSYVNYLLKGINSSIYTFNSTVLDDVFYHVSKLSPIAITNNFSKIVLFSTSYLKNGQYIANTSFFSYINSTKVSYGPFPVVSEQTIGKGKVIVISDMYFLTNYLINYNSAFFNKIVDGNYYIATFLLPKSPQYVMKLTLLEISSYLNYPYIQLLVIAFLFLISSLIYRTYETAELNYPSITDLLREHPDWDEEIIRKIIEEKKSEAGRSS